MKSIYVILACMTISMLSVQAQDEAQSISKSLGVFVFPPDSKDKDAQEFDEFKCYQWAVQESGVDPMKGVEVEVQQTADAPDGSAVRGAAKGAAVGAAIGAISGDAGKGAAIGAVAGGAGGIRQGRMRRAAGNQKAEQSAAQQEQALMESFKKAYSVCLEAKGYTVKI